MTWKESQFPSVGFPNDSNLTPNGEDTVCVIIGLDDQAAAAAASRHELLSELRVRRAAKGSLCIWGGEVGCRIQLC